MMQVCVKARRAERAAVYFQKMVKSKLTPDAPAMRCLRGALGKERSDELCAALRVRSREVLPAQAKPLLLQNRLAHAVR